MSDGPHRSLPMRPGWRRVAEFADNQTYPVEDVCDAVVEAVGKYWRKDIPPKLVALIRDACEPTLFPEHTVSSLESLRSAVLGSAIGDALLDNLCYSVSEGKFGEVALEEATLNTLRDHPARCKRQIGEHYLRKSSAERTRNVEQRVEEAIQIGALKSLIPHLLNTGSKLIRRVKKHDGVEDGVRLP